MGLKHCAGMLKGKRAKVSGWSKMQATKPSETNLTYYGHSSCSLTT